MPLTRTMIVFPPALQSCSSRDAMTLSRACSLSAGATASSRSRKTVSASLSSAFVEHLRLGARDRQRAALQARPGRLEPREAHATPAGCRAGAADSAGPATFFAGSGVEVSSQYFCAAATPLPRSTLMPTSRHRHLGAADARQQRDLVQVAQVTDAEQLARPPC